VSQRCWTLSPSDFGFLCEECPRCFYLKVVRGFPRPRPATPSVATLVEAHVKACCAGRRTETLAADMPAGVLEIGEQPLESLPLDVHLPDAVLRCHIRGTCDTLVRLDEGGYALVDVQAGARLPAESACQARQLHACAYALEHPAPGAVGLGPVSRLGRLVFEPEKFDRDATGLGALTGGLSWVEIPRDDSLLFGFLAEALALLEQPLPPGGAPLCDWCVYRDASRRTGL
jgi:hypothetical protein